MTGDASDPATGRSSVLAINNGLEVTLYKRFAARVPEMLEKYPIGEFRYETSWTDDLSLEKGRLEVFKAAAASGKLQNFPTATRMICTRRLLNKDGVVLQEATAAGQIVEHKDYEKLETAAYQRLAAYLGFGGEILQEDEDRDLQSQSLSARSMDRTDSSPVVVTPLPVTPRIAEPSSTETKSVVVDGVPPSSEVKPESTVTDSVAESKPAVTSNAGRQEPSGTVSAALKRQVTNMATRLGLVPHAFNTNEEAQKELARLAEIQRNGRRGRSAA